MSELRNAHLGSRYLAEAPLPTLTPAKIAVRDRLRTEENMSFWESVPCLCGHNAGRIVTDIDRYGLAYRNILCDQCGLMRASPRWTVERYSRFYEEDYRDLYSPAVSSETLVDYTIALSNGPGARHVATFVKKTWSDFGDDRLPVVIEMGAGGGWNLARLPTDWTRIGFDTDERYLEAGRVAFGIQMQKGFVEDVLPKLHKADIILLSHVLEHFSNPVGMIQRIAEAARLDTLILIEVPGVFRLHKSGMDPMRYWQNAHTYTFTARTLADTCRRAGFEPLRIDEHIQMVYRPGNRVQRPVVDDLEMADDVLGYLKACEWRWETMQLLQKIPLLANAQTQMIRLADLSVRAALMLGFMKGPGRHLVKEA